MISMNDYSEREIFENLFFLNLGNKGVLEVLCEMSIGMGTIRINAMIPRMIIVMRHKLA